MRVRRAAAACAGVARCAAALPGGLAAALTRRLTAALHRGLTAALPGGLLRCRVTRARWGRSAAGRVTAGRTTIERRSRRAIAIARAARGLGVAADVRVIGHYVHAATDEALDAGQITALVETAE